MPLRRVPGPPDLARVAAVLSGSPPSPPARGWVPATPSGATAVELVEQALLHAEAEEEAHPGRSSTPQHVSGLERRGPHDPRPAGPVSRHLRARRRGDDPGDIDSNPDRERDPVREEIARLEADLRSARRPSILTVPEQLRAGRLAVSSSAVVGILALVVALACIFAVRVLWAERSAGVADAPTPGTGSDVSVRSRADEFSTGSTTARSTGVAATQGGQVVVHVVGQVKRPGLVRLLAGSRVADAIERAGGPTAGADLSTLNLARVLVDGEQVRVPRPGETPTAAAGSGAASPGGGAASNGSGSAGLVDLNTADLAALDTLPGVGPVLAQRIVDWRSEHGRFTSVEELGEVSGIGEKLYAQIRPKVTV